MDHVVKLKEVPKGQRLQYMWDYWRLPALIIIICIVFFGLMIKTIFFSEKVHMEVLLSCKYEIYEETLVEMEEMLERLSPNGEEHNYLITYAKYNPEYIELNPVMFEADKSKLMAELTMANSYVQLLDEELFEYFKSEELLGTYKELGIDNDELIKIPADNVLKDGGYEGNLYFTLRPREYSHLDTEEKKEMYDYSVNFIKAVMEMQ